jgi:RNA polymerase sigma-70 factor, ECF subfamily
MAPDRDSLPPGSHELDPARLGDHLDRLYRAAWGLCGSREDAEDLVQETYARVLARPRFVRRGDDLAYLLRALRNTFLAGRRRVRPAPVELDEADSRVAARPVEPDEAAEQRRVYSAISELSAEFRDALVAVDLVGLSYREAARALRAPEGTITSRLSRAREQVAERLS